MFLARPHPKKNEHILNYLLRLSIVNGFKNIIQLLRCSSYSLTNNRLPPKKIFTGDLDKNTFLKQVNISNSQLDSMIFHPLNQYFYKFNSTIIPISSIDFTHPKFCPICFCGELNQPIQHLLLSVTHCEKHQCQLIEFNPENSKRLTWSTANLLHIMEEQTNSYSKEQTPTTTQNINELLALPKAKFLTIGNKHINLSNYLLLLHFFAHYHQRSISTKNKRLRRFPIAQRAELFNIANDYLKDWPNGFYRLLMGFEEHPMAKRGEEGIRHCYRDLYDEIYLGSQQHITAYQLLMDTFESYLKDEFSASAFTNSLTRIETPLHTSAIYIGEKSATKLLNIPISHLKLFVNAGLLTQQANGTFLKKDIDEFIIKAKDFITLKETIELLDIGKSQVLQLVDSGLLKCVIHPDDQLRDWLFDKQELQALTSKIQDCATTPNKLPASLKPSTFKALTFKGTCISNVIENILSNKTTVIYIKDPNNLLSLQQFHPCIDISFQPNKYISPKQASKAIGVNINAIYDFVKQGFLTIEKQQVSRTPRPVKLIPQHSIDSFKNSYALSKQLKGNIKNNYQLVSGPSINEGVVNLYIKKLGLNN